MRADQFNYINCGMNNCAHYPPDARHRYPMHPKERAEVHGGPGVAVVAAVSQAHAHAQRQPNRGSAQVENGEIVLVNFLHSMQR